MNDILDTLIFIGIILFYVLIGLSILSIVLFPLVLGIGRSIDSGFITFSYKIESMEDWDNVIQNKEKIWNKMWYDEIELLCDLDFQDKEFIDPMLPINGNGHAIKNLSFTVTNNGFKLFSNEIKNLNIENIFITSPNKDLYISIFGYTNNYFENVSVSGTINAPFAHAIGGFCTSNGHTTNYKFKNCTSDLNIIGGKIVGGFLDCASKAVFENCENKSTINAQEYAGGFLGKVYSYEDCRQFTLYPSDIEREVQMTKCVNNGSVASNGCVGGLIGEANKCKISECENNGEINGTYNVGGLTGILEGEIKNSINNGKVIADKAVSDGIVYLGGISGNLKEESQITSCINNGNLDNKYYVTGGIVGNCYGGVAGCENNGNLSGKACVGGIVGYIGDKVDPLSFSKATIRLSHCTNNGTIESDVFAGGIIGMADLNYSDSATYTASEYVTKFIQIGFDFVEFGYDIANEVYWGIDVNIKRYDDDEIFGFTNDILDTLTRATKLEMVYCTSNGKIIATNYAGGFAGIMFSCAVEVEELNTNNYLATIDCNGLKSEGYNYVNASDVSKLK